MVVSLGLIVVAVALSQEAPGHTRQLEALAPTVAHLGVCASIVVAIAALPLALCLRVLRRLRPDGAARIAAAAGAGGGALGGLAMQFLCDIGGRLHAGVAHGGAVLLCALVGAALGRAFVGGPALDPRAADRDLPSS